MVSFAGALLGAIAFTVSLYYELPPTDGAYKIGLWKIFMDPLVDGVALLGALIVTVVAAPFVIWSLRRKVLRNVAPVVIVAPAVTIALLVPFIGFVSLAAGLFSLTCILVFCRFSSRWSLA
jgi:hypothetical protein